MLFTDSHMPLYTITCPTYSMDNAYKIRSNAIYAY